MDITKIDKFAALTDKYPKCWIAIKVIATALPAPFLGYATLQFSSNVQLPGQATLQEFFIQRPFWTVLLLLWPFGINLVFALLDTAISKAKNSSAFSKVLCSALLAALDDLVGTKLRRFDSFAKKMAENTPRCSVFDAITQPNNQIKTIVMNVHHVLEKTTQDETLQLIVAKINDDTPSEWVEIAPNHVQIPLMLLQENAKKTLFYDTARQRKILYIQDIEHHIQNRRKKPLFYPTNNPDSDKGSIICYPVVHQATDKVVYVISIKSNQPNAIKDDFKSLFRPLMEAFTTRLLLEYNLQYIKERSKPCQMTA